MVVRGPGSMRFGVKYLDDWVKYPAQIDVQYHSWNEGNIV